MNKSIKNYDDLLIEQVRLKNRLSLEGQQIKNDIDNIKIALHPMLTVFTMIHKLTTRETRNETVVKVGSAIAIDWMAKKMLPKNILVRILLTPFIKNISSHLLYKATHSLVKREN